MLGNYIMRYPSLSKLTISLFLSLSLAACGNNEAPSAKSTEASSQPAEARQANNAEDVVAKVGDQIITYSQLNTTLNSSPMVGLSIPALGTPRRNQVIITLLDKFISSNLTYLDARNKGTDRQTKYLADMKQFEDAVLMTMYKSKVLIGDIPVGEAEVVAYYDANIDKHSELNEDVKLAIESKLRKQKLKELKDTMRERLRAGTEIKIFEDVLSTDADANRSDADVVASIGDKRINWSDVELPMRSADHSARLAEFYVDNDDERLKNLQEYIDNTLMVDKARASGMDKSAEFEKRTAEYRKSRLINIHREGLLSSWQPSEEELKTYYLDHKDKIAKPETRKVQTVVVKTKEEAQKIKQEIDSGKITMFKAAQDYSLDPNAKSNLGELGWVAHGTGFKELDDFTFNLEPEVVGGPVESPAGWHLVKVLDVNDGLYQYFDDPQTRKIALREYLNDKFNDYVVDLRKNHYEVAVYEDVLFKHFQKEAELVAELTKKAQEPDSVTRQREKDLEKWMPPPVMPTE